eukprot:m.155673 g.155673  ORF g.155673 m.155673 type:complete len:134 (+) comp23577_c0_seq1:295-696(+)
MSLAQPDGDAAACPVKGGPSPQLRAALADPAAPVPEGARRMTVDERTEQVAMVAMALEKQGCTSLAATDQAALTAYVTSGIPFKLEVKTPKGFVACTLANITNSTEREAAPPADHVPGMLIPESDVDAAAAGK